LQNMNPNPDTEHLTAFLAHLHAEGLKPHIYSPPWRTCAYRPGIPVPATLRTMREAFIEPGSCVTVRWGDHAEAHFISEDHGTTFKPEWVTWERFLELFDLSEVLA